MRWWLSIEEKNLIVTQLESAHKYHHPLAALELARWYETRHSIWTEEQAANRLLTRQWYRKASEEVNCREAQAWITKDDLKQATSMKKVYEDL